mmetsp:Transcript_5592/g.9612  ORF Transcript_5592/g.9612 Transcript_5592/m.9612 type:complete len:227 (+) Transcript_5592:76-756(+)|eukprot:CAMPEP_0168622832 /NCGR_PEP_ID=MMETSP0449_2-20121227/8493_1 /TAXON_ID=1082188 /ORGANISM="Strombidium rassoulzadegani, Strain ras09" /LENGTH=226 /DNA_ID=CAMNT_0008664155 /DNA_START=76 /DNA_END=756 /DNA_ORIENTATION=+
MSGVDPSLIKQLNVVIYQFKGEDVYIRTNICGSQDKPKLVWIHGYASSGPLFFKIIKQLIEHFCVIFIDMLGMGGSSRPEDFFKDKFTPEESIGYFVDSVEKWRQQMHNHIDVGEAAEFTDFYLAGHSFGGYIVGNYGVTYPSHIRKLLMLSPIGIRVKEPQEEDLDPMERFKGRKGPPSWVKRIVKSQWKNRASPFDLARKFNKRLSMKFIQRYIEKRQKTDNTE